MFKSVYLLSYALALCLLVSCTAEQTQQFKVKPTALGKAGEIIVVVDSILWYSAVGEAFQDQFLEVFLISPQPESIFDIKAVSPAKLDRFRQEQRNMVILGELNDQNSPTTKMIKKSIGGENTLRAKEDVGFSILEQKDRWAEGQITFYLFGHTDDQLIKNIKKAYPVIKKSFIKNDLAPLKASVYLDGKNGPLSQEVLDKHQLNLSIPGDYYLAVEDETTQWIRKETRDLSSNIIIHTAPYTKENPVTKERIISLRDSLGRRFITSDTPGSYMHTDSVNMPLFFKESQINGNYALEARGLWNIKNDFMGGAFLSYMVFDPNRNRIIFLDGFVHAPGKGKRNYINGLDYIFKRMTF